MKDPAAAEWRRLLKRLRNDGPSETTRYVLSLARKEKYPSWYSYRLAEYLMKHDELDLAGKLLTAVRKFGQPHPLIDRLYGTWLWCIGKRPAAIRFVGKQARSWPASFLYSDLSAMYSVMGKTKIAEKHLQTAGMLADREVSRAQRSGRSMSDFSS
jgi:hypothetical protein